LNVFVEPARDIREDVLAGRHAPSRPEPDVSELARRNEQVRHSYAQCLRDALKGLQPRSRLTALDVPVPHARKPRLLSQRLLAQALGGPVTPQVHWKNSRFAHTGNLSP